MTTTNDYINEAIGELVQNRPDVVRAVGLLTMARLQPSEPQMSVLEHWEAAHPDEGNDLPRTEYMFGGKVHSGTKCESCGMSYADCSERVFRDGKACCARCKTHSLHDDQVVGTMDLPPMKRLNTKVKTLDVSCPTCKASPGKRCFRMSSRGPNGVPTDEPLVMGDGKPSNHKSRTKRAQEASS